jgi:hypothetical protein
VLSAAPATASRVPQIACRPEPSRSSPCRGRPFAPLARPALVDGAPGVVVAAARGRIAVAAFRFAEDRIAAIDLVTDLSGPAPPA